MIQIQHGIKKFKRRVATYCTHCGGRHFAETLKFVINLVESQLLLQFIMLLTSFRQLVSFTLQLKNKNCNLNIQNLTFPVWATKYSTEKKGWKFSDNIFKYNLTSFKCYKRLVFPLLIHWIYLCTKPSTWLNQATMICSKKKKKKNWPIPAQTNFHCATTLSCHYTI